MRDGGKFEPVENVAAPDASRAHGIMRPRLVHYTKTAAAIRTRQNLQVCMGMNGSAPWRPKGKRRVLYTTTVRWDGQHASGPNTGQTDEQYRGVKILPKGK